MKSKKESVFTKDDILNMLEEERLERERIATTQINAILTKYHCHIDALVTFGPRGMVSTQINITARKA